MAFGPRIRSLLLYPARRPGWTVWFLASAIILGYSLYVFAHTNKHAVIEGRVYRCSQPTGDELRRDIRKYGIRTVVNLRGTSPGYPWYQNEAKAIHEANANQEDITFSATRLPPAELRRLIEVFDRTEYPILIHCKQGADRTGLASAITLLLFTDVTLAEARRELWPLFGHFPVARTAAMDEFFDRYEAWLEGKPHKPDLFRTWALKVYSPGPAKSELLWREPPPTIVKTGQPFALKLRAVNRSTEPWQLKPGNHAGIHLAYKVADDKLGELYTGQAGLFRATVPTGQGIDLELPIPAFEKPGRYAIAAEMTDGTGAGIPFRQNSFVQFGDESIMAVIEAR